MKKYTGVSNHQVGTNKLVRSKPFVSHPNLYKDRVDNRFPAIRGDASAFTYKKGYGGAHTAAPEHGGKRVAYQMAACNADVSTSGRVKHAKSKSY